MSGLVAIFRKEMNNFFVSPIAYTVIACFLVIAGFFFWANLSLLSLVSLQAANDPSISGRINLTDVVIRPLIQNMSIVLLFLIPLLTMRLFSEERKSGTIELLLTYPVNDLGIVLGKFLAAVCVFLIMMGCTLSFALIMLTIGSFDIGVFLSSYLGLILMGASFIALGVFISSVTENQIVAAAASFGAALMFWIISWTSSFTGQTMGAIIRQASIIERLDSFLKGVITLSDVTYFVFFTAFFLFLSFRSIETQRWRG
ncbi:MAG: ABC transporter permease subunit [Deltaproteobacteria bacterium]|nr:ABC transporter permease subunit [Deltaproteobacteria bacterium]